MEAGPPTGEKAEKVINQHALKLVESSTCGPDGKFRFPTYDGYCFSRLPAALEFLLTADSALGELAFPEETFASLNSPPWRNVIVVLVDGFGWRSFEEHVNHLPFLKRFADEGVASPVTAQFPSTTAAHMTTLHTGLTVAQTGVYEWFYYEPLIDEVIAPLLYAYAGDRDRETLAAQSVPAGDIFPFETLYERLARRGVSSMVFQHEDYTSSTYSTLLFRGAELVGWPNLSTAIRRLVDEVLHPAKQARYFFLYIDSVDGIGHEFGPLSRQFARESQIVFSLLEQMLYRSLAGRAKDTLLLLTADHGQISTDPESVFYLNLEEPHLVQRLKKNKQGKIIPFAGSCRDLFLHVERDWLAETHKELTRRLSGIAEVWSTADMLEQGFFGGGDATRLKARIGDLAILPYAGKAVHWFEEGRFSMRQRGSHGGLTPEEMDTGVYVLALDE